jgi:hypothetical protein
MRRLTTLFGITLLVSLFPLAILAQNPRSQTVNRTARPALWWITHHSIIAPDGTFLKLVREAPASSTSTDKAGPTWKFEVVSTKGAISYTILPGYPSHFRFGEIGLLYVTVPDPEAWKNREPGKLPANAKTKLYIVPAPYDDAAFLKATVADVDGFAGSLRVRTVGGGMEWAYLLTRDLSENPALETEENGLERNLVVIDSAGKQVYEVTLSKK